MMRHIEYLKYVLRHKWHVFQASRKLQIPFLMALFHDWDKFLPDEWFAYAKTFYAWDGTKQYEESIDFATAWMKHQHRNKHHWQYWCKVDGVPLPMTNILIWDRGEAQEFVKHNDGMMDWVDLRPVDAARITCDEMPELYVREMLADWQGAGKALGKPDTLAWWLQNRDKMILGFDTRNQIDRFFDLTIRVPYKGEEHGRLD
jgi:hypothetical protein